MTEESTELVVLNPLYE